MPQVSTTSNENGIYLPRKKPATRWVNELKDAHVGDTLFLLGNGYSARLYDPIKMKASGGYLMGCNDAFKIWPLDYVVAQDPEAVESCAKAACTKLLSHSRMLEVGINKFPYDSTYAWGFGKYQVRWGKSSVELGSSGAIGLQLAHYMGFDTVIIVGCDCQFYVDSDCSIHSNVLRDKQAAKVKKKAKKKGGVQLKEVIRGGTKRYTSNGFIEFAKKFEELYDRFKDDMGIYRLGDHGIIRIPSVDTSAFDSNLHPRKTTHDGRK